jgi:hypothetical protein
MPLLLVPFVMTTHLGSEMTGKEQGLCPARVAKLALHVSFDMGNGFVDQGPQLGRKIALLVKELTKWCGEGESGGGTKIPMLLISCKPRPFPPRISLSGFGTAGADPPKRTMESA